MKLLLYERELMDQFIRQIRRAKQFCIAQALITLNGLEELRQEICASLARGSNGRVLVGVDMPTEPVAIESLLRIQENYGSQFALRLFKSGERRILHAKFAVFKDGRGQGVAILGSSNLTLGGLLENYEANVLVSDQRLVDQLLEYFDEHFSGGHSKSITSEWLKSYQALWSARQAAVRRLRTVRRRVRRIGTTSGSERSLPKRIKDHIFAFTGGIYGWPRDRRLYPRVKQLGGTVGARAQII